MIEQMTVIYLTASMLEKHKPHFAAYQKEVLLEAIKDTPIISVSREPLNFGHNILDDGKKCTDNIYRQMLRACKVAETKYVAVAEDDCLYHEFHFTFRRPCDNEVLYDRNRATLFTWGIPVYHWRNRLSNAALIAPREYLIDALEERYTKWPDGCPENRVGEVGRGMVERNLGVGLRNCCDTHAAKVAFIQVNHDWASEERQRKHRKSYGEIQAYDIPYWGRAEEILKHFR